MTAGFLARFEAMMCGALDFVKRVAWRGPDEPTRLYSRDTMKLDVSGHPLHSRSLTASTFQRDDGAHRLEAAVVDLRKCGFVPVAGILQPSGIIHHMTLEGVLDPESQTLVSLEGSQPTRPFDPSTFTGGECCSDPVDRLRELAGERLDGEFAARLQKVFGGGLGCSHLLSLAQIAITGVVTALDWDRAQPEQHTARRRGERTFHRAIEIDGFELPDGIVRIAVQLTDLHFRAAAEVPFPMDRFGAQTEVRLVGDVDLRDAMRIRRFDVWQRRRDDDELETATFVERSAELQDFLGQSVAGGLGRRLLDRFAGDADDRPFLDTLLSFAPGYIQCVASLSEEWPLAAKRNPSLLGVSGRPDSCHMWRTGGALQQRAASEKPAS